MRLPITLHHEGFYQYLRFCVLVWNGMRHGNVAKPLRKKMYKKMIEAWKFNPRVDYPQVAAK